MSVFSWRSLQHRRRCQLSVTLQCKVLATSSFSTIASIFAHLSHVNCCALHCRVHHVCRPAPKLASDSEPFAHGFASGDAWWRFKFAAGQAARVSRKFFVLLQAQNHVQALWAPPQNGSKFLAPSHQARGFSWGNLAELPGGEEGVTCLLFRWPPKAPPGRSEHGNAGRLLRSPNRRII